MSHFNWPLILLNMKEASSTVTPFIEGSISIPVTITADGQVTSSQSFTVPVSGNVDPDHTYPFALPITTELCWDFFFQDITFQKCKLLPSVGQVHPVTLCSDMIINCSSVPLSLFSLVLLVLRDNID